MLTVVPGTLLLWWGLGAKTAIEPTSLVGLILLLLALTSVLALVWPGRADQAEKD